MTAMITAIDDSHLTLYLHTIVHFRGSFVLCPRFLTWPPYILLPEPRLIAPRFSAESQRRGHQLLLGCFIEVCSSLPSEQIEKSRVTRVCLRCVRMILQIISKPQNQCPPPHLLGHLVRLDINKASCTVFLFPEIDACWDFQSSTFRQEKRWSVTIRIASIWEPEKDLIHIEDGMDFSFSIAVII